MKRITYVMSLFAFLIFFSLADSAKADVVDFPVDTELFFYLFITIVIVIIALIITIEMKRRAERKKRATPSSPESEKISRF
jgi:uncharacterized membrane protein YcaP (DUF421 family)